MLNVTTLAKLSSPSFTIFTRHLYVPSGELPVGKPSTKGRSGVGLNVFMRVLMYIAAHSDMPSKLSRMMTRMLETDEIRRCQWLGTLRVESESNGPLAASHRPLVKYGDVMADRVANFNAGPAALPLEVLLEAQRDMLNWRNTGMGVMEVSHRSAEFEALMAEADEGVRKLL